MYGIKAYSEAGFQQKDPLLSSKIKKQSPVTFTEIIKNSGDSICFSEEAMQALSRGYSNSSNCPQDATYTQDGIINRQFEAVQRELKELSQLSWPVNISVASQANSLQNQAHRLQMLV